MNKKFILAGLVVAAGFVTLTAFGGKTLEQQKQEIASAITARLDEFRTQKEEECTTKVNEEAQRRYQEFLASVPASEPAKPAKGAKKKVTTKSPLPQTAPVDPQKQRGGAVQQGNVEEQKKRGGAIQQGDAPQQAQQQKQRPGAAKQGGN